MVRDRLRGSSEQQRAAAADLSAFPRGHHRLRVSITHLMTPLFTVQLTACVSSRFTAASSDPGHVVTFAPECGISLGGASEGEGEAARRQQAAPTKDGGGKTPASLSLSPWLGHAARFTSESYGTAVAGGTGRAGGGREAGALFSHPLALSTPPSCQHNETQKGTPPDPREGTTAAPR
ncbi:hypothetical protein E2C01_019663 [Portunus trituberculatus]|uniref:Uncharacterized protein n=1 Tax=Portunus trituberculatus TaxID=210409 RepID=A0A5B7DZG1_PORTR|nr:hypothetical protein [Portunus trituberculatus]